MLFDLHEIFEVLLLVFAHVLGVQFALSVGPYSDGLARLALLAETANVLDGVVVPVIILSAFHYYYLIFMAAQRAHTELSKCPAYAHTQLITQDLT